MNSDLQTIIKALEEISEEAEGEVKAKLHIAVSVLRDVLKLSRPPPATE